MGAAAAAVAIAERRMIQAFEIAGATSPETARTPSEVGVDEHSRSWHRLVDRAVIREESPGSGRYYIDREVWQAVRRTRMRVLTVFIIIVAGVWLYFAILGLLHSTAR